MTDTNWKDYTKGILKAELAKRNISYTELAKMLGDRGIEESPQNISNKIARGTFGAIFMMQVLDTIGCDKLFIDKVLS
ncbi:MAG: hypothetical protein Rsou_1565 [Candidatus Ruthia sp. Asou_11_S2]|nr:hypothetical protein [Candidatus Ruthia sp. Asou_11_S2]MBW5291105.1 hypothetical protein [Candidatus Ruthia sp. Asou_11_S2]